LVLNEEVIVPTPTWCLTARSIYFELFFFLFLTASSVFAVVVVVFYLGYTTYQFS
jgi:hypothetical protein